MASLNLQEVGRQQRVNRRPKHPFHVRSRPWQIQPFFIAPVLPGETTKNLFLQARVVTDPLKNPLIGWWQEYYFFYVKHRDLTNRDDFVAMMMEPNRDMSALYSAANVNTYHFGGSIDWLGLCMDRITEEFFRDEDQAASAFTVGGVNSASIAQETWLDSVINDADFITPSDVDVDGPDANTTIQASEIDAAMRQWQFLRAHSLTTMEYEDYLRTYGVRVEKTEPHKPELLRRIQEWTYPTNTVNPATGKPSSAAVWSIADRVDKDYYHKEPGFIVGCCITRPKVYLSRQVGSATGLLSNAFTWLPAIMSHDPYTSLTKVAAGAGPMPGNTDAYWVDVKDLFLYGEQFVNFALTETDAGMVALPTASMEKRYASATDADALFASASPANQVRQDGIVQLVVAGTQVDTTPSISAPGV